MEPVIYRQTKNGSAEVSAVPARQRNSRFRTNLLLPSSTCCASDAEQLFQPDQPRLPPRSPMRGASPTAYASAEWRCAEAMRPNQNDISRLTMGMKKSVVEIQAGSVPEIAGRRTVDAIGLLLPADFYGNRVACRAICSSSACRAILTSRSRRHGVLRKPDKFSWTMRIVVLPKLRLSMTLKRSMATKHPACIKERAGTSGWWIANINAAFVKLRQTWMR